MTEELKKIKAKFKRDVKKLDTKATHDIIEAFHECIDRLPNSFAKGYLTAKLDAHDWEDFDEAKEDLLILSDYDIWK